MNVDHELIERLHAQARRERAREVYQLLCRAAVWVTALFSGANASARSSACCPNPA